MTVVIETRQVGQGRREISVAGHLSGASVEALEQVVAAAPPEVTLDLSELRGIDEHGEALLRRLRSEGAHLTRLSRFVSLMLVPDADFDHTS